jgi:hypothetical protein
VLAGLASGAVLGPVATSAKRADKDLLAYYNRFERVENLYDGSGAVQLPDGRVMVVQDSRTLPLSFLRRDGERFVAETWTGESLAERSGGKITQLADLEEVVLGADGFVYALSSHVDKEGAPSRQSFARFRVNGERIEDAAVYTGLKKALLSAHPALAAAATLPDTHVTFNIEGFTFDRDGKRALIGFRAPLADNKAILVAVDNPFALFNDNAAPQIGDVTLLDLDGDGIRAIAWLPKINGYLISGREFSPDGNGPFRLWFWSGEAKAKPRAVSIEALKKMRRPEGISPVVIDGQERILLVSDEGNKSEGKESQIALIAYEQLRIAP